MIKKHISSFEKEILKEVSDNILKEENDFGGYHKIIIEKASSYIETCIKHAANISKKGNLTYEKHELENLFREINKLDNKFANETKIFGVKPFDPNNEKVVEMRKEWVKIILEHFLNIMKSEVEQEKDFNNIIKKAYKKKELEKAFHNRMAVEQKMFETLIETSHPALFFHRSKMKRKLKDFFGVFEKVYEKKVEKIYS